MVVFFYFHCEFNFYVLGVQYVTKHLPTFKGNTLHELLVELTDVDLQTKYAHYSAFSVGPETEGFPLKVLGGYEGDAGDSLSYHAGSRFSTKDVDHDGWNAGSCAQSHGKCTYMDSFSQTRWHISNVSLNSCVELKIVSHDFCSLSQRWGVVVPQLRQKQLKWQICRGRQAPGAVSL